MDLLLLLFLEEEEEEEEKLAKKRNIFIYCLMMTIHQSLKAITITFYRMIISMIV